MNRHPLIECHDVTLAYGRERVLERVNLTIQRGVLLPFIGPNGAGKTTLIKACLGLVPCHSGRIVCHFGSQPPAYVPQQKQIDPIYPLSVRDLVLMGLYPERGPWGRLTPAQAERLRGILLRFGLQPHEHKRFGELSGGLRQKTLLARAAISQSDLLVLDEPTAGLDAASEADLLELIQMLHAEKGKTILWVHHRLDQCTALVRQICRVEDGKAVMKTLNEVTT